MSILRTTARSSLVKARLAYYAGANRSVSTTPAALREGSLPSRDWGTPLPSRDWGSAPTAGQQPRRNRRPNDRNNDRPQGDRDSRGPRRDFGLSDGSPTGHRGNNNYRRNNNNNRRQPSDASGSSGFGLPKGRWDVSDGGSRAPKQFGLIDSTPTGSQKAPATETDKERPRFTNEDSGIMFKSRDEDRHGLAKPNHNRHGRESRSLLREVRGELEIPGPDHHRSLKGKGKKKEPRDRDRDRREFVVEDEDEEAILAHMRKLEEERSAKQSVKQKIEAAKAKKKREQMEREVYLPPNVTVAQLSEKCHVSLRRMQGKMRKLGMPEDQMRADFFLSSDQAFELALEFDLEPIIDSDKGFDLYPQPEADLSKCPLRPPVVTIMGHVDHGKTTLLDSLRKTSVAAGEAGGITQHIGAFSVPLSAISKTSTDSDATITFLDTPGHAAFTGMRARGASITDLVVLVVAADDGVMPQTKEVLNLVSQAGDQVGLIVAINKCDKPQVDIERVKSELGAEGIILEEDGGDAPAVRVSGLTGMGLDELTETLSTVAELRELRARADGQAEGWVLESNVDKGRGIVATVLVTRGTLTTGASIVAGHTWCRVRQMMDPNGNIIQSAGPGMPVSISGWRSVPEAGDQLLEAKKEDDAKRCVANREREIERRKLAVDIEAINIRRQEDRVTAAALAENLAAAKEAGESVTKAMHAAKRAADEARAAGRKELRLVIKGDVSGTVEAVVGSLQGIGNKEAGVKVVHTGVGDVSESDIHLAEAAEGLVIGFSVECPKSMEQEAKSRGVPVLTERVIYRLIDDVRKRVAALLPPRIEYKVTGEAVVQQVFEIKLSRKEIRKIAGCKVANGVISRNESVRVLRGPKRDVVFEGTMETLKHVKKDVMEMRKGTECGIGIQGFQDLREGDEIVSFQTFEVAREL